MTLLQITVDSALESAWATGVLLIKDYWWFGVVVLLAYFLRWYRVAKEQDHKVPESAAIVGMFKHMYTILRRALNWTAAIAITVAIGLGWAFQVLPTIATGLGAGDPTVWASVVAGVGAMANAYDLRWTFEPAQILFGFIATWLAVVALNNVGEFADGIEEDGDSDDGDDESSSPVGFP